MSNVQVSIRIRPLIKQELLRDERPVVESYEQTVSVRESMNSPQDDPALFPTHRFTYDAVFNESASQKDVYQSAARGIVENFLAGYNGCIMAYGQTGSGKTHTIMNAQGEGIIPQALSDIFAYAQEKLSENKANKCVLKASFYQIYNENVFDLLNSAAVPLRVREANRQIYIEGLQYFILRNPDDLTAILTKGNANRIQAETSLNANSSRSHSILTLYIEQQIISTHDEYTQATASKLMILDLAGSERAHSTEKKQQRETKFINQSLAVLGNVMQQIVQNQTQQTFIQFRDSKLTRVLQDAVGGNCQTSLICNISPSQSCFSETLNTLKFADRAKQIKQHAIINETDDNEVELHRLSQEIKRAREQVAALQTQLDTPLSEMQEESNSLAQQKNSLEEQLNSQEFAEFTHLISQIKELDEQRAQALNQQTQLTNLRQQSLRQRDALLLLTTRLQERENTVDVLTAELQTAYNNLRILRQKIGPADDGESPRESSEYIGDSLEFAEKIEELSGLFTDFTAKKRAAEVEWTALQKEIAAEQVALQDRVRQIMAELAETTTQSPDLLPLCLKERDLLIKIFADKIVPCLTETKTRQLREYLARVKEAILQGTARAQLERLFGFPQRDE